MANRATTANRRAAAGFDLDDKEYRKAIKKWYADIRLSSEQDLIRLAIKMTNEAKRFCPVDTGRLRASITHRSGSDAKGLFVDVGSNVKYAQAVEFGTSRSAAQPFLRPAYASAGKWWKTIVQGGAA